MMGKCRHLLQEINSVSGMHIHNSVRVRTRGTVIGILINICVEPPQQEKTDRQAFNTNAFGLQTQNNSGMEPTYMLHVNISGGLESR